MTTAFVVTLIDYVPLARFDGVPWTTAKIDEGPTNDGPWTLIDTIALNPLDVDPSAPMVRNFTTQNGTIDDGWYRVSFFDSLAGSVATEPVQNVIQVNVTWRPTVPEVADLLWTRTIDKNGDYQGTFNNDTRPTGGEVEHLITQAVLDCSMLIGNVIPASCAAPARNVCAVRTAMYVELTYFPEQMQSERSPYDRLKELYDQQILALVEFVQSEEAKQDGTDSTLSGGMAVYGFPSIDELVGWATKW